MSRKCVLGLVGIATLLALTTSVTCQLQLPQCDAEHYSKIGNFTDLMQGRLGEKVVLYSTAYTMSFPTVSGAVTELTKLSGDRWQIAHAVHYTTGSCQQVFNGLYALNPSQHRLETLPADQKKEMLFFYHLAGDLQNGLLLLVKRTVPWEIDVIHVLTSQAELTPDIKQFREVLTAVCGDLILDQFFTALKVNTSQTVDCPPLL